MPLALALPGWGTSPQRLEPLCAALREHGVDAQPYGYEAVGSVSAIGERLAARIAELTDGGADRDVHLVGHSLGGLASASAVLDHGAAVCSVTTINTPWRGTWVAWTADRGAPLGHELRWRSPELRRLRTALGEHLGEPTGPRWTMLAVAVDLAASPATSLRVPTGDRLTTELVGVTGHSLSLLKSPMIERVVGLVTAGADAAGGR